MYKTRGEKMVALALLPKVINVQTKLSIHSHSPPDSEESENEEEIIPSKNLEEELNNIYKEYEVIDANLANIVQDELLPLLESLEEHTGCPEEERQEPSIPNFVPPQSSLFKKSIKPTPSKKRKIEFRWKKKQFKKNVTLPELKQFEPEDDDYRPVQYFYRFFSDEVVNLMVTQSNLYCTQKGAGNPSTTFTKYDILDFIAILLITGVVPMPDFTDYWSKSLRYNKVADIMSKNRFRQIRRFLHFVDNTQADISDRFFKIRPLVNIIRREFREIEEESRFSIDEMMVPYKGKKAGSLRQYIKNKPVKWGFKIFVRSGISGMVYDFYIYSGKDTFKDVDFSVHELECFSFCEQSVIALCKSIKTQPLSVTFFDNWFSTPNLMVYLRKHYGILSLATMRKDRLRGAPFKDDKELKKEGRGSFDYCSDNKKCISLTKWYDNKAVITASTYIGPQPVQNISRWSREKKVRESINCPAQIKEYNTQMGGVDLSDMLIALYRTNYRSHKYYLNIFSQMLDLMVNNAWLLYKRDYPQNKMTLKHFRISIADDILLYRRPKKSNVGRSPRRNVDAKNRSTAASLIPDAARLDGMHHWQIFGTKGKCRLCHVNQTVFLCQKCNLRLCNTRDRPCFLEFHGQK